MRIDEEKRGRVTVARVREKRIDAASAAAFKGLLLDAVARGEKRLVLDLAEVAFIDSSGLGAIVSILKALQPEGELAISRPGENVQTLFRLTRMNRVFTIFASEAEAVQALEKG